MISYWEHGDARTICVRDSSGSPQASACRSRGLQADSPVHLCTRPHQKKKTASEIEGSEYNIISLIIEFQSILKPS